MARCKIIVMSFSLFAKMVEMVVGIKTRHHDDRKEIMQYVHKLVYAKEIKDLKALLSEEIKDSSSKIAKYSNVLKRVKEMQENEEEWAIAHASIGYYNTRNTH